MIKAFSLAFAFAFISTFTTFMTSRPILAAFLLFAPGIVVLHDSSYQIGGLIYCFVQVLLTVRRDMHTHAVLFFQVKLGARLILNMVDILTSVADYLPPSFPSLSLPFPLRSPLLLPLASL